MKGIESRLHLHFFQVFIILIIIYTLLRIVYRNSIPCCLLYMSLSKEFSLYLISSHLESVQSGAYFIVTLRIKKNK